jgi:hypothetical protein
MEIVAAFVCKQKKKGKIMKKESFLALIPA